MYTKGTVVSPGIEPGTCRLEGDCSIQLSYETITSVRGSDDFTPGGMDVIHFLSHSISRQEGLLIMKH